MVKVRNDVRRLRIGNILIVDVRVAVAGANEIGLLCHPPTEEV
jgi:hypothetical protein